MSGNAILVLCVLFSAAASVLLKLASGTPSNSGGVLSAIVVNPKLWLGGVFYAAAFIGYIYALRLVPLSLAQPVITAGVSVVTALVAVTILREEMGALNWGGLGLICLGLFFLFFGRA